jgi:prepilin-type N-terminal cleavage/methylation domain-containing protein
MAVIVRALRARLRSERGFTLVEIVASMAILGLVLGGVTMTLASATHLEANLSLRYKAQQGARTALAKFRSDVHCASDISPTSGDQSTVTLTLPSGCTGGPGSLTWCAVASGTTYDLWRMPGSSCTTTAAGAARWAQQSLVQKPFTPDETTHANPTLPSVTVNFKVAAGIRNYALTDLIYLRNGARK